MALPLGTLIGCSDKNFLDKTKIDGSILMGKPVQYADPIANQTVLIAQNFEYNNHKPLYFGFCSGVIIDSNTILTAAHCAQNFKTSKVIFNPNMHAVPVANQQFFNITKAIIHEKYVIGLKSKKNLNYDLALLKLDRPVTNFVEDSLNLDSIPTSQLINESDSLQLQPTIAGFGKNRTNEIISNMPAEPITGILEKAHVKFSDEQYSKPLINIDQHLKPGVCSGDSGGPLFVYRNNQLYLQGLAVAVTTSDDDIACTTSGIFLNLDFFKEWIFEKQELQ